MQPGGQHIARTADITLAADNLQYAFGGYDDLHGPDFGSQDFDVNLEDLDFGDGPLSVRGRSVQPHDDEDSMEIEVGRDAAAPRGSRESLGSHLMGRRGASMDVDVLSYRSRDPSEQPFAADMSLDLHPELGELDLADFGLDFGDGPKTPREQSHEVEMDLEQQLTPRLTPPELTLSRACK